MTYKVDESGRIVKIPTIMVETVWGPEERLETDKVSLFHPDRCEHDNLDKQPADRSVGIMSGYVLCEDCGADVTDMYDDADEWDDGDRAYDSWKDSQFDRY